MRNDPPHPNCRSLHRHFLPGVPPPGHTLMIVHAHRRQHVVWAPKCGIRDPRRRADTQSTSSPCGQIPTPSRCDPHGATTRIARLLHGKHPGRAVTHYIHDLSTLAFDPSTGSHQMIANGCVPVIGTRTARISTKSPSWERYGHFQ